MKRTAIIVAAAFLFPAAAAFAQGEQIDYTPIGCIRAGQAPLMQLNVAPKGELRAYFRRVNTTDWCSVEGKNIGPLSSIVLPKFAEGDEIEYFFVVLDGKRVIAKSPRVYRAKSTSGCEGDVARHMIEVSVDCSAASNAVPAALGAGYTVQNTEVVGHPPYISPDRPTSNSNQ